MTFSAEIAELQQDILSSLAHELGGIASALDLRAAALAGAIPDADMAALRGLSEELRLSTRGVRLLRVPQSADSLAPGRSQTLADWWRLTSRFSSIVLPRGISMDVDLGEGSILTSTAVPMTWLWLSACKDISERDLAVPGTISLRAAANGNTSVTFTAEVPLDAVALKSRRIASRWARYAGRIARAQAFALEPWSRKDTVLRWRCVVTRG
jgi:hypothetical protein